MEAIEKVIENIQKAHVDCGGRFIFRDEIREMKVKDLLSLLIPNGVTFKVSVKEIELLNEGSGDIEEFDYGKTYKRGDCVFFDKIEYVFNPNKHCNQFSKNVLPVIFNSGWEPK